MQNRNGEEIPEENIPLIEEMKKCQAEIVALQDKFLLNSVIPRNRRIKLTENLEYAVRYCYGVISYLDGTYKPEDKKN